MKRFSERIGVPTQSPPITIRHEAPLELRGVFLDLVLGLGLNVYDIRRIACEVLQRRANADNWSQNNVYGEAQELLDTCEWYEFYDLVEAICEELPTRTARGTDKSKGPTSSLEDGLNAYFSKRGIGWQLRSCRLEVRGPEAFQDIVVRAQAALTQASLMTAAGEVHEALCDLSRRPEPDITGAIQHALAAVECAMREICDDQKPTMGKLLAEYPDIVPPPLDIALEKVWGFASERGRHLREGRQPSFADAELTVSLAAAVATYLVAMYAPNPSLQRTTCE